MMDSRHNRAGACVRAAANVPGSPGRHVRYIIRDFRGHDASQNFCPADGGRASAKAAGLDAAARGQTSQPLVGDGEIRTDVPPVMLVSAYTPAATPGMPGPYPGRVVSVSSDKCVDTPPDRPTPRSCAR